MISSPRTPKDLLWQTAALQRGYLTSAQALEAGYSYQAQHFHLQRGNWLRVDRGVHRLKEFELLPAEGDEDLVRWSLWSQGQAVVSHATALAVHDLGIANPEHLHFTVPPGFRRRTGELVLHRTPLDEQDIEQRTGYRVTKPVRAVVESAAAAVAQDVIDSAVADLLDRGLGTRRQLLHQAALLGPRAELGTERALQEIEHSK